MGKGTVVKIYILIPIICDNCKIQNEIKIILIDKKLT